MSNKGIDYGVIGMNSQYLTDWAWDFLESDYGEPTCPKCGDDVMDYDQAIDLVPSLEENLEGYRSYSCSDYVCLDCKLYLDGEDAYGDEPIGYKLDEDGYQGWVDSSNDLFLTKSPYYIHAQFCSPCAPGAGHLENPCEDGVKTYCLGHDWFRDGKAPYPVYSVVTGELVEP